MQDILIIASDDGFNRLSPLFSANGLTFLRYDGSIAPALTAVAVRSEVYTPAFALSVSERISPLLLLSDVGGETIKNRGIFLLPEKAADEVIIQAVRFCIHARGEVNHLRRRLNETERQLSEIKLLNRAKCVLIQCLKMTENDAHKYIQRQAMSQRVPQTEIAKDILKTYEY